MFTKLKEPFGKAGLIVAIVALVAALAGGAYAASATDSGKRNNKKGNAGAALAKKYSKAFSLRFSKAFSKRFAVAGPAGPQGSAGADGAQGPKGDKGDKGANGSNGSNGVSVTGVPASAGECPDGGVKYTSASGDNAVCNGADGEDGEDGESGFTATLPPGETETGAWAFGESLPAGFSGRAQMGLSFPIPLADPLVDPDGGGPEKAPVHTVTKAQQEGEEVPAGCTVEEGVVEGSAANPVAAPGNLCVYEQSLTNAKFSLCIACPIHDPGGSSFALGAGRTGAILRFQPLDKEQIYSGYGTFAVTAPEE